MSAIAPLPTSDIVGVDEITPSYADDYVSLYQIDCFDWLRAQQECSVQAVVTDPPYTTVEFERSHIERLRNGHGGVWRLPPNLEDGYKRLPLPRFTVQSGRELAELTEFFEELARQLIRVLVPGGHLIFSTNPLVSTRVYGAVASVGFERRGELIRLTNTLRGGDRPKGAEGEFIDVTVMPKSRYEPWGIFRRPIDGTVANNLRNWGTGGLRRPATGGPFSDVFRCRPAAPAERALAHHPSLKPQRLMRHIVRAVLPLGRGTVLDPFAGSGSTLAAAAFVKYRAIGLEVDHAYAVEASQAIPRLAAYIPRASAPPRGRKAAGQVQGRNDS